MAARPEDDPWSRHRSCLGKEAIPRLTTDWIYSQFPNREIDAVHRIARFAADGVENGPGKVFTVAPPRGGFWEMNDFSRPGQPARRLELRVKEGVAQRN